MSGYSKSEDYGYEEYESNTRPTQQASYQGFAQPSPSFGTSSAYTPSSQATESLHGLPLGPPLPLLSGSVPTYAPRDSTSLESPSTTSYVDTRPQFVSPIIIPPGPYQGAAGETFRIDLQSDTRTLYARYFFTFHFGAFQSCKGEVRQLGWAEGHYRTPVVVEVPDLGTHGITMPLMLEIHDENALLEQKTLGQFFYSSGAYTTYPAIGGKRKFSDDSSEYSHVNTKRSASQPLQPLKFRDSSTAYSGHPVAIPAGSSYSSGVYGMPSYGQPQVARSYGPLSGSRVPYDGYSMSPNLAPRSIKARSPTRNRYRRLTPSQSPRTTSQMLTSADVGRSAAMSAPTLIRTSMSRNLSIASPSMPPSFNPYAVYPNARATLNIHGDLQTMTQNWTAAERTAKRRLVEFTRSQNGGTVDVSFKAVSPEERSPNNTCISCIYWERRKEYFCTSVDTIALLEALVTFRFCVEEKNRIRRNLEGFKPYTVSKSKDECDDIFRLIMGFPNPKPRNIEKDIKIFSWHNLSLALTKIIGKYSVSYSSTSARLTPPPTTSALYGGGTTTETSELPQSTSSPENTPLPALTLTGYQGMTSRALSPGLPSVSAGYEDLRPRSMHHGSHSLPAPGNTHLPQWQPAAFPQHYTATGLATHPTGRSWELAPTYLEQGTAAASPTQVIPYHRSVAVGRGQEAGGADAEDTQQHQTPTSYVPHHQQTSRP